MNEIIHKNFKRFLAGIGALVLLFPLSIVPVFADASSLIYTKNYFNVYVQGDSVPYQQFWIATSTNSNSTVSDKSGHLLLYRNNSNSGWNALFWFTETEYQAINNGSSFKIQCWRSSNNVKFDFYSNALTISNSYTGSGTSGTGNKIYYGTIPANNWVVPNCPRITLNSNSTLNDILYILSFDMDPPYPWEYTDSSGGKHWEDGTELDGENVSKYENIFVVMDSNNDNSVTESEVNYYNYTYNTNYDYSSINNSAPFTENDFLYWVALSISDGNTDPGGGTGGGSGSGGASGGITVTDSFTQSQSQTIAENAVNVTVTNNNELNNENLNHINQIINNNPETTENTFQDAIGNMNQFRAMAAAFAALAGVVLGWLPGWVTGLIGLSFSVLSVMIIFRLIHLFV